MTQLLVEDDPLSIRRRAMVHNQLRARGIRDERVLQAMLTLPRHRFVPRREAQFAYDDCALSIGFGQTISQPYMVALMLELLELTGHERVLDVGTGSGYQAALLGLLSREVFSVELVPELASRARNLLDELGFHNVKVALANGSIGLPQAGPFDAIVVAAGAPALPTSLMSQLDEGGRLVIPIGARSQQTLVRVTKRGGLANVERFAACNFVPLIGEEGWVDD